MFLCSHVFGVVMFRRRVCKVVDEMSSSCLSLQSEIPLSLLGVVLDELAQNSSTVRTSSDLFVLK